jgi:hypothetical protein
VAVRERTRGACQTRWGLVWRGTGAGAKCPSEPRPSGVHPEAGAVVRSEKLREHTGSLAISCAGA